MKIMVEINMTAKEAQNLWRAYDETGKTAPKGQELREWASGFAASTLESTWQYDAQVFADIKGRSN